MQKRLILSTAILASGVAFSPVLAQDSWREARSPAGQNSAPEQFGTGLNNQVVPASKFNPLSNTFDFTVSQATGYTQQTSAGAFWTPLDLSPGVEVTNVCINVFDMDAAAEFFMIFGTYEAGTATSPPSFVTHATTMTAGMPGYTLLCATPASPVLIRAFGDPNGDGVSTWLMQFIGIIPGGTTTSIQWAHAVLTWRRVVRPAPGSATFLDVPTSHPFFQFIEALAASGVTLGCGGGNYCPNDSVTRAQMAAFLARALGLYWPN